MSGPRTMRVVELQEDAEFAKEHGVKPIMQRLRRANSYNSTVIGLHGRTNVLIDAILSRKTSSRFRWPIGRAKPFVPWTIRREDLVTVDEDGKEQERVDLPEFTAYVTKASAEKGYNFVGVQTFLGMLQAQKTRGNKREGWAPDGQSLEAGA